MTVYDKKESLGLTSFPSRDLSYSCRFVAQFYPGKVIDMVMFWGFSYTEHFRHVIAREYMISKA